MKKAFKSMGWFLLLIGVICKKDIGYHKLTSRVRDDFTIVQLIFFKVLKELEDVNFN